MVYLQLLGGFVVLLVAAEVMIRGAVALARRLGVSPMIIGMTVIALGTSAPEFVVALDAAVTGAGGLALGNLVGSNIANVMLILGASALMAPMVTRPNTSTRDAILLVAFTGVFVALCLHGDLTVIPGAILLLLFIVFLAGSYWQDLNSPDASQERVDEVEEMSTLPDNLAVILLATGGGLAGLIWGADLLVTAGVEIARAFGASEELIGLTVIAIGTSLPELVASVVAAVRGHSDVAIGNVIGSNVFNILGIAGAVALVAPLPVSHEMRQMDLWVMLAATLLMLPLMLGWLKLGRVGAIVFLLAYTGYIGVKAQEVFGFV